MTRVAGTPRHRLACTPLLLAVLVLLAACGDSRYGRSAMASVTGGDASRGPELLRAYGCKSCHTIPGVVGANGLVGPPLAGIAERSYIAGVLPNAPENMIRWIMNPKAVDPLTAMPVLGVSPSDARDITAYLYTLR